MEENNVNPNQNENAPPFDAEAVAKAKKKNILLKNVIFGVIAAGLVILVFFVFLKGDITKSEYEQIKTGMSYSEVCDIIGCEGEEGVSGGYGDYTSAVYSWKGPLYYITGANAAITFSNGEVSAKAAVGLIW